MEITTKLPVIFYAMILPHIAPQTEQTRIPENTVGPGGEVRSVGVSSGGQTSL